ncbi:MAG: protein-glutamate O-methyltransferase CheR [Bacteroidetes bacterium]|nr:protein-glutamate O-methyltransferase CheR [Bacteroidota bacterium]
MDKNNENINIEIKLFLEAIFQKYGYDFRNYSLAHIKRRILHRLSITKLESISLMQHKVLTDPDFLQQILLDFSINVTEMFRDPDFYLALRKEVIPILKTYPFIKIWHAGCSTGEEVYSMAIVLKEEGLLDRTQLYATDFNQRVLKHAKEGVFSIESIKDFTQNYIRSGGTEHFSDYYIADYDRVIMDKTLSQNVLFAHHNLVTDNVFSEVNMVICRNVLIYFDRDLQNRAIGLFKESLLAGGILCLGSKESLQFNEHSSAFSSLVSKEKIYRKNYLLPTLFEE